MFCGFDTGPLTLAFHPSALIWYPTALFTASDGQNMFASWLVLWKETYLSDVKRKNIEVC